MQTLVRQKAKITIQRVATDGTLKDCYTITKITGPIEVTIEGRVQGEQSKTFRAGDNIIHAEAVRLSEVSVYDVTTMAPGA